MMNAEDVKEQKHLSKEESNFALKFSEKGLPRQVFFYCSPLMRCVEEQYRAVFRCVENLNLLHPSDSVPVECTFSYMLPDNGTLNEWNNDASTLYVLAMNVRELKRMLQRSNHTLPLYYVWYQTEQFSNTRFFRDALWMRALSNALWIWEYSEANAEYLKTRVGSAKITLVRHAFCKSTMLHKPLFLTEKSLIKTETTEEPVPKDTIQPETTTTTTHRSGSVIQKSEQPTGFRIGRVLRRRALRSSHSTENASCDVLLLGLVAGAARKTCVTLLREKYRLNVSTPPRGRYWYGEERETHIRKAKVCINVHYFRSPSVLETARLNLLLANGSVVISEHSTAAKGVMDRRYEKANAVLFVAQDDFDALGELCRKMVDNNAARLAQQKNALAFANAPEQSVQEQTNAMRRIFRTLYTFV